jgi:putative oxidoreductase
MPTITDRLQRAYSIFVTCATSLQSPFLLFVRLYWGWQFFQTGWGKLHNLPHVVEFFTSLGIPAPALNAYFVSSLECFGGILLAIGLGSRLLALMFTVDMVVAYITADRAAFLSIFSKPDDFIAAIPFAFLMASLIILIFGPGKIAVDYLLERRWRQKTR